MASMTRRMGIAATVVFVTGATIGCSGRSSNSVPPATAASTTADDDEAFGLMEYHRYHHHGGVLMNADTQAPFTYKDTCIELNPHIGGNPATAEAARKAVSDFLLALFKLG